MNKDEALRKLHELLESMRNSALNDESSFRTCFVSKAKLTEAYNLSVAALSQSGAADTVQQIVHLDPSLAFAITADVSNADLEDILGQADAVQLPPLPKTGGKP